MSETADLSYLNILRILVELSSLVTSTVIYPTIDSGQLECVKEIFTWLAAKDSSELNDGLSRRMTVACAFKSAAAGWRDESVTFILASCEVHKAAADCALLEAYIPTFIHHDYPKRNAVRKGSTEEARKKQIDVVKLLLDARADIDAEGTSMMKPVYEIGREGSRTRDIFDILLDRNAH